MTLSEAWVDFLAGWASGAFAVMVCQPVDTVLTRFQAGVVGPRPSVTTAAATATSSAAASSSNGATIMMITSSQQLVRNFGITSLWRGASPMISAVPLQNSLLMGGYGLGKRWAATNNNDDDDDGTSSDGGNNINNNNNWKNVLLPVFVGGCTGGVAQSFLMSPVEYVKVRQQVAETTTNVGSTSSSSSNSARAVSRHIITSHQHLWSRGLSATLWRDGIPHGVWFVAYEWCKTTMITEKQQQRQHYHESAGGIMTATTTDTGLYEQFAVPVVSGAFAATVAWVRSRELCVPPPP